MVNKGGPRTPRPRRNSFRQHEKTLVRRASHSSDVNAQIDIENEYKMLRSNSVSSARIDWFGKQGGYDVEHVENAAEEDNNEEEDEDAGNVFESSDEDVSHKHFDDHRSLRAKKANTRFRRHSTPAEIQQRLEQTRQQSEHDQRKVITRYVPRRQSAVSLECITSSESESDDIDGLELGGGGGAGLNNEPQEEGEGEEEGGDSPKKLTRKQRRQQLLKKKHEKELVEVHEVYAEDSDSSIDLSELNEIERKYFEKQRAGELARLTKEWEQKMKIGNTDGMNVSKCAYLPPELLDLIFAQLEDDFAVGVLYVCRAWYSVGIEHLYRHPKLTGYNFAKFVETLGNKSKLGHMVKVVDLRHIQGGRPSATAKVLRRCNASVQVFIAPQTSFGYAPSIALKNCKQLRILDLSLVSETVDLRILFNAIENATHLERLDFPRSSVFCLDYDYQWPENLWNLGLAGGISNEFLHETHFPETISHLTLSHCPFVRSETVRSLAARLGPHLSSLRVLYPLPALRPNAFDTVFRLCPVLETLIISVDYCSRYMFAKPNLPQDAHGQILPHPLKRLTLDSSGSLGQARKIHADDISLAILDEKLPHMSQVRVSSKLGWDPKGEEMSELAEVLDENNGGVWIYNIL